MTSDLYEMYLKAYSMKSANQATLYELHNVVAC